MSKKKFNPKEYLVNLKERIDLTLEITDLYLGNHDLNQIDLVIKSLEEK